MFAERDVRTCWDPARNHRSNRHGNLELALNSSFTLRQPSLGQVVALSPSFLRPFWLRERRWRGRRLGLGTLCRRGGWLGGRRGRGRLRSRRSPCLPVGRAWGGCRNSRAAGRIPARRARAVSRLARNRRWLSGRARNYLSRPHILLSGPIEPFPTKFL